ncbi:LysR family transcriptional regulator [Zhihengliuella salsuginis]|uniref:Transcriptional regulator n=1 Tax=Zhihengliuella salsuginis TaxID=578222 RepID=A0ABQ3GJB0_9MICC|nr:LysR family transcriptional regulator [Zhihengliuella salsuginis]GHD05994.1 transcriptional regulator [Zhihengliuella salsuginis]
MTDSRPPVENWLQLPVLRLLVGIADHGSLSAAARATGMAQSNASRSLKTLERRLGYTLVRRSTRGSTLTSEGQLTAGWARDVLAAAARFSAGTAALAAGEQDELPIGCSMTIAEYLAPTWIGAFRTVMPRAAPTLRIANSRDVVAAVVAGDVLLGFVESPDRLEGLLEETVYADELVVVVDPAHPWAADGRTIEPAELGRTQLVEREAGSGTRAALDHLVGGDRPAPVVELNSIAAVCQSVIAGLGPAVLSRLAAAGELDSGRIVEVPVAGGPLRREFRAIWTAAAEHSRAAREFLAIARGGADGPPAKNTWATS